MHRRIWPYSAIVATLFLHLSAAHASDGAFGNKTASPLAGALITEIADLTLAPPTTTSSPLMQISAVPSDDDWLSDYFTNWFKRVDAAQAGQPHWVTPIATVTPRLEEEVRYDQFWQHQGNDASINNYDGGKGLELIPTTTNEVILNLPAYERRSNVKPANGYADDAFLLIKQRLFSANAQNGDYILTAFLGITAPTGGAAFTNNAWVITPTIAAGKGFGKFDVQGTMGVGLPISHDDIIGKTVATNVAFQYHIAKYLWPEFEVNDTYWSGGERHGKNQVLLTPGIIFGRFLLGGRFKGNFGVGYQYAVSPTLTKKPVLTPTLNSAWIFTARLSF
jgi:hypothetical protein